ncbi:hypothetical protein [Micromonospora sp. NPDC003776]
MHAVLYSYPRMRVRSLPPGEARLCPSNYSRDARGALPNNPTPRRPQDSGALAPAWKTVGQKGTERWHDHRIHWMGQARPPALAADPRHPHPIGNWVVHATIAGQPLLIAGDLAGWASPTPRTATMGVRSWLLWLIEAMAAVISLLAALLIRQSKRTGPTRQGLPEGHLLVSTGPTQRRWW